LRVIYEPQQRYDLGSSWVVAPKKKKIPSTYLPYKIGDEKTEDSELNAKNFPDLFFFLM